MTVVRNLFDISHLTRGDFVTVYHKDGRIETHEIAKVTQKKVTLTNGADFDRSTGAGIGAVRSEDELAKQATLPQVILALKGIRRAKVKERLDKVWNDLPFEAVCIIEGALNNGLIEAYKDVDLEALWLKLFGCKPDGTKVDGTKAAESLADVPKRQPRKKAASK